MSNFDRAFLLFTNSWVNVALAALAALALCLAVGYFFELWFYLRLIVKSLGRNLLRSSLTSLAVMVLVLVVTLIWTVLATLDAVTTEKSQDFKAIATERWQIPSQMPPSYVGYMGEGMKQQDVMSWTFYGGTTDPGKRTRENIVFFFAMNPARMLRVERDAAGNMVRDSRGRVKYTTMMDGLDEYTDAEIDLLDKACREMEKDRRKVVMGKERLALLQKRVGEKITVTSFNYVGVDLEVEIIGEFPDGRYNQSALVNVQYIMDGLDAWKRKNGGKSHPMADKSINLVWLRVPNTEAFRETADRIMESATLKNPAVKVETASSGVASFLDAYRDILWGVRWLLVPAILVTMAVVIANAISISVRERRTEMAVLKVLGFGPTQVMVLVLGEAVLIGALSGLLSSGLAYFAINAGGGLKFPIAFFPAFRVPAAAFVWGLGIGGLTALFGSLLPAWSARSVKVAEVFSKLA